NGSSPPTKAAHGPDPWAGRWAPETAVRVGSGPRIGSAGSPGAGGKPAAEFALRAGTGDEGLAATAPRRPAGGRRFCGLPWRGVLGQNAPIPPHPLARHSPIMNIDAIPTGSNPPEELNVIIEVPLGGEPIKYEIDKASGALFVDRFLYTPMRYPGN